MGLLRVAAVQYGLKKNRTFEQLTGEVERLAREAASQKAELLVFPELIALDLLKTAQGEATFQSQLESIARELTPRYFDFISRLAQDLGVAILGGSSPRWHETGVRNAAILAFKDGRTLIQDKIFLTPDEIAWEWVPGDTLHAFDAPWGRTAILICFDCEFPILSQKLAPLRPELILVPSMTGDAFGLHRVQWTAQARAIEHHAYVVHTGTVPTIGSIDLHCGQASLLTPQEDGYPGILARGERDREQIVTGDFDMDRLRDLRSRGEAKIDPVREQNKRVAPLQVTLTSI